MTRSLKSLRQAEAARLRQLNAELEAPARVGKKEEESEPNLSIQEPMGSVEAIDLTL